LGRPAAISLDENAALRITRSGYGGRLNVEQEIREGACIAAVRSPSATTAQTNKGNPATAGAPTVRTLDAVHLSAAYPRAVGAQAANEANLDGARRVVSGG